MGRGVVCSTFPCVLGPRLGRAWRDVILMRRSPSPFSVLLSSSAWSFFCHLRALSFFLVTRIWFRSFPKPSCSLKPFLPALLLPRIFAGKCWRLTVPLSVLPIGLAASHGFAPVRIHTPIQHRRIIDFLSSPGLPAGLPGRRLLLWGPPARLFGQGFRPDGLPSLRCGLTRTTGTSKISTVLKNRRNFLLEFFTYSFAGGA